METIIESRSSYSTPIWMKFILFVFGCYCIFSAVLDFSFYKIILIIVSFYGIMYKKKIYISSNGITKEVYGILGISKEFLPWEDVKAATFAYKGDMVMVFFERGITGWKLLFKRSDAPLLEEIIKKYAPKAEVDFLGNYIKDSKMQKL
ncbi:hypothetical protein SAMN03080603_00544 [Acetomicrobium thermoterrenum DSM 13490]|uniref:Bacterial PH domain-containing protein n=1 Tax=Acetomicrobium thermoterrenum DSM 13490 TaxID=1120987 RepID=A0A1H3EDC1_9BACT|nr:hypothetical protein [Acetomicrobium thermoterrenum]SDX75924.1 hypothetical protein SAMN03080603_00544 [Acetomicrobium thermoterrenum DSM 13490]